MLTDFDKRLLNRIQTRLPLAPRPFAVLAEELGTDEATVLERLQALKAEGLIRRIGPFFDSVKMGYVGTLVAVKVNEEALPDVAVFINQYPGVTHNYEREGEFNLWFTLMAPSPQALEDILAAVTARPGVVRLLSLPATEKFKVSVQFTL